MDDAVVRKTVSIIEEGGGELLRTRRVRETMRYVYRVGDYVAKVFEITPANSLGFRKPWEIEVRALQRLGSDYAAILVGLLEKKDADSRKFFFIKKYVPGAPLEFFSVADMADVAREMAFIHSKGIITDDANVGNFIREPSGRILFLDFGRTRIFSGKCVAPAYAVGKELAKLYREGCGYDSVLWNAFLPEYYKCAGTGMWRKIGIEFYWRLAKFFRDLRKGKNR